MPKVKIHKTGGQIVKITIELNQNEFNLALESGALQALSAALRAGNNESSQDPMETAPQISQAKAEPEAQDLISQVNPETQDSATNEDKPPWENESKNEKEYTEVGIRAKFVELAKQGKKAELKDILSSLGVQKVSDIKPEQYQEAMAKLEAL